jgi:DNA polymerase-1
VLWPEAGRIRPNQDANNYCLVSLLNLKGVSMLHAADLTGLYEPYATAPADILKIAITRILRGLPDRPWLRPILQIHDELTFLVPEEKVREATAFIRECMEEQPFPEFDLPLQAEASCGQDFADMREVEEVTQ